MHTNKKLKLTIQYGPDEQRILSKYYTNNITLAKTKCFVGDDYELEKLPNGTERRFHYLPGGGMYISSSISNDGILNFILTDYQGTWNKVVSENGTLIERYNLDPWGKRRNTDNGNTNYVPATFLFDRDYTGHEMLDAHNGSGPAVLIFHFCFM